MEREGGTRRTDRRRDGRKCGERDGGRRSRILLCWGNPTAIEMLIVSFRLGALFGLDARTCNAVVLCTKICLPY